MLVRRPGVILATGVVASMLVCATALLWVYPVAQSRASVGASVGIGDQHVGKLIDRFKHRGPGLRK